MEDGNRPRLDLSLFDEVQQDGVAPRMFEVLPYSNLIRQVLEAVNQKTVLGNPDVSVLQTARSMAALTKSALAKVGINNVEPVLGTRVFKREEIEDPQGPVAIIGEFLSIEDRKLLALHDALDFFGNSSSEYTHLLLTESGSTVGREDLASGGLLSTSYQPPLLFLRTETTQQIPPSLAQLAGSILRRIRGEES